MVCIRLSCAIVLCMCMCMVSKKCHNVLTQQWQQLHADRQTDVNNVERRVDRGFRRKLGLRHEAL